MTKHCDWCAEKLTDERSRFEVRVAPGYDHLVGIFCGCECWEAAKVRKSVQTTLKTLISDAETVLSDEGKIFRR